MTRLPVNAQEDHLLESAKTALSDHVPELAIAKLREHNNTAERTQILAQAYLESGNLEKATTLLEGDTFLSEEQKNTFRAHISYQRKQYSQALAEIDTATKSEKNQFLRAHLLVAAQRQSEAIELLENLWKKKQSDNHSLYTLLLSELYLLDGRQELATQLLNGYVFPKQLSTDAKLINIQALIRSNKNAKATAEIDTVIEQADIPAEQKRQAKLLAVEVLIQEKKRKEAVDTLLDILPTLQKEAQLQKSLTLLQILSQEAQQRKTLTQELGKLVSEEKKSASTPYVKHHLAHILYGSGKKKDLKNAETFILSIQSSPESLRKQSAALLGNIQLKLGKTQLAATTFLDAPQTDEIQFQKAYASWLNGNWAEARRLFQSISLSNDAPLATAAKANLATLIAKEGSPEQSKIANDTNLSDSLQIELAFTAVRERNPKALQLLEKLIKSSPQHPRINEVKLALAQILLEEPPSDAKRASDILRSIKTIGKNDSERLAILKIQAYEQQNNWSKLIETAKLHLKSHPDTPQKNRFLLKLAEAQFENGNYNEARINFTTLAEKKEHELTSLEKNIAYYYAGLSAARVTTEESKTQAIKLFTKSINKNSPFKTEALKSIATLQLEQEQYENAFKTAQELSATSAPGSEDWLQAQILLANSKLAQRKTTSFRQGIQLLESAYSTTPLTLQWKHRFLYLLGFSHEKEKYVSEALENYLTAVDQPPTSESSGDIDWYWFEQCGFRAISLLEQKERWSAAIVTAKKIGAAKGPNAAKAQAYAKKMSLKHMLWDEQATIDQ